MRRVQTYLHPDSEHWIDWFHITLRITVLQQQTKSMQGEANNVKEAAGLPKQIDSVKHLLWHGNVAEALDRMVDMLLDLEIIRAHSAAAEKLAAGLAELRSTSATSGSSFRTSGSATVRARRSARRLWSRRSIRW